MPSLRVDAVLDFWFGPPTAPGHGQSRGEWFRKDAAFDAQIRAHFVADVEAAIAGQLTTWSKTQKGALALLILLDQFPRNLFRNTAKAFAGDALARTVAQRVIDLGWDADYLPVQRVFIYLPFEHAESLAEQARSLQLFSALAAAHPETTPYFDYAERHQAVIAQFGRFPHRNGALGRTSTAAELAYLAQPGSGF